MNNKLKIFVLAYCILSINPVFSQKSSKRINMPNYDQKRYHFGISLAYNMSDFKVTHSESFIGHDSILVAESKKGPGFNLGIIADVPFGKFFDVRFIPTLAFAEKGLDYTMKKDFEKVNKNIESVYLDFPLLLKFKSERVGNFRAYVIGGAEYFIDMASNAKARKSEDKVKVAKNDYAYDYGAGVDIYFPMFKLSLEIKMAHGISNVLVADDKLIYADVLQSLHSRTYLFSVHFE